MNGGGHSHSAIRRWRNGGIITTKSTDKIPPNKKIFIFLKIGLFIFFNFFLFFRKLRIHHMDLDEILNQMDSIQKPRFGR
jgi:hypothetical protein